MAVGKSSRQYMGVRAINPPDLTIADRAPTANDTAFLPGQLWLYPGALSSFQFSGVSWIELGTGVVGDIATLTGNTGGAIAPVGGNISIVGDAADGVSVVGTAGTLTINIAQATTNQIGVMETSTNAESVTGVAVDVAVTPASLSARMAAPGQIGVTTPGSGAFTTLTSTGATNLASGAGVAAQFGNTTGTLGFYGSVGTTRIAQAALTNSVTAGGVTGTIANYTDLTVYANDAAAIRNDIYQLSLALANVVGALRGYGLLS